MFNANDICLWGLYRRTYVKLQIWNFTCTKKSFEWVKVNIYLFVSGTVPSTLYQTLEYQWPYNIGIVFNFTDKQEKLNEVIDGRWQSWDLNTAGT